MPKRGRPRRESRWGSESHAAPAKLLIDLLDLNLSLSLGDYQIFVIGSDRYASVASRLAVPAQQVFSHDEDSST